VPELDNNSYYINPKYQKDIRMIFDYMFSRRRQIISNQILLNPQIESSGILSSNLLKSLYFFVEACEYKRHFLHLDLDYAAITSLELDHTDYYKDMKDYTLAFKQFSSKVKNQIFIPKGLQTSSFKLQAKEVSIKKLPFKHIR
jgi:UDP-N-acetylmuramate-alanine ligase